MCPTMHFVTYFLVMFPWISLLFSPVSQHGHCWEEKKAACSGQCSYFVSSWGEFTCTLQDEWLESYHWEMAVVKQYNPLPPNSWMDKLKKIRMEGVKRPTTESNCSCVHQRERKQLTKKLFAAHRESNIQYQIAQANVKWHRFNHPEWTNSF